MPGIKSEKVLVKPKCPVVIISPDSLSAAYCVPKKSLKIEQINGS
jgi:hypothetical protein